MGALFEKYKAKLRAQFSSEFIWRCYVVLTGVFICVMVFVQWESGNHRPKWYFIFPSVDPYEHLRGYRLFNPFQYMSPYWDSRLERHFFRFFDLKFWLPVIYYLIVPFIIVKVIDWVAQAREGGPSEKIRNKPPIPRLESAVSKHNFGKSEERVAERGLQRQRSEKWKGPLWFCLRILVWLVAFAIGATIVRMLARGYIGG